VPTKPKETDRRRPVHDDVMLRASATSPTPTNVFGLYAHPKRSAPSSTATAWPRPTIGDEVKDTTPGLGGPDRPVV